MTQTFDHPESWSTVSKLLFRFFAIYFLLYIFPFPLGYIPFTNIMSDWYGTLWDGIVVWSGNHVFHLKEPINTEPNGSGDTTYKYLQVFIFLLISTFTAVIWTILDRKRRAYRLLYACLMIYVRYYLSLTMIIYGFYKVFKSQFPFPYYRLLSTYSESSPMGLLWSFMGYSNGFNIFTGMAEILGGALLLFRKTTTIGALISITVTSNIVAMNLAFDVPVKLFSMHLLVMAVFLAVPNTRRLVNFFFLNKAVPAAKIALSLPKKWMRVTRKVLKPLLIVVLLYAVVPGIWQGYQSYGDEATEKQPYFGFYHVTDFIRNSDTIAPLTTDTTRWKMMSLTRQGSISVKMMNDSTRYLRFDADTVNRSVEIYSSDGTNQKSVFAYATPNDSTLILNGKMNEDSVYISMRKLDYKKFRLISRGFHWINEYPYNR